MKFQIEIQIEGKPPHVEIYDKHEVQSHARAVKWAQETVAMFNATLRHGERPRTLLSVTIIDEGAAGLPHTWQKQNLVTQSDGHGVFDIMKCAECGATGRRYGLSESITRSQAYRAKKWNNCPGSKQQPAPKEAP
ncbi:hypothetical protein [Comamonas odontotermitis]|uniref:hypothetical protein n=1 Tax=Comamonas odontotermitis TaxID=379895 RepID=UPI001CC686B5|nr:hypothetical protein [Comamonas odontotermitis]UBB15478.1 hypothetical protein LAD35_11385 [Comamonas odontotermitis]